jgi:hypothetical protein
MTSWYRGDGAVTAASQSLGVCSPEASDVLEFSSGISTNANSPASWVVVLWRGSLRANWNEELLDEA